MTDRDFWMQLRQALLMMTDCIERRWEIEPRTSDLRKQRKKEMREQEQPEEEC
jgi:hypothetical protein